jgi:hypothetical protein
MPENCYGLIVTVDFNFVIGKGMLNWTRKPTNNPPWDWATESVFNRNFIPLPGQSLHQNCQQSHAPAAGMNFLP